MSAALKAEAVEKIQQLSRAESRLKQLGIVLPIPPQPFGAYAEAVQSGNLLFLSGMLPTEGHGAKFVGRVDEELDVQSGCDAARLAALNVLAVARQRFGSLDRITRIVRLVVSIAVMGDFRDHQDRGWRVRVAARRFWKREKSLPIGVRRRQPSARYTCRSGSHFRSCALSPGSPFVSHLMS